MTSRFAFILTMLALAGVAGWQVSAQQASPFADAGEAGEALRRAGQSLAMTRARAEKLEQAARNATADADRTARESAAVAARIQQSEAEIELAQAKIALIDRQRESLRDRMAERQEPVVRLTAALQMMARRPLAFSLVRAESLRDTVYLRAVMETMLPEVRRRTAGLRAEIQRGRKLQEQARLAARDQRAGEKALSARKVELAALESRQRLASRAAQGVASREADQAMALAEQARDLSSLMAQLQTDGALRSRLAALPGPVLPPSRPGEVLMVVDSPAAVSPTGSNLAWIVPLAGRLVSGFGEQSPTGLTSGIALAANGGAQVVSPADGRIAFAGPYRGYGRIVIVEHDGGWTTLVTNLGRIEAAVGERVVQGSPIGSAGAGRSVLTVEVRRDGVPVNPLEQVRG
ncbi:septal ring factor EnvC (AmiA/AmiB activator) [Novosphingobium hassiacum]|uniref:Septal ring factor EnvC (AmiA/AmiB activator) n=1 Tax=Novosphingobium hassiacum TaxID=173676 RepID=A0A7W5ZUS0_9SPHN|nr:peptidoglycan DD-metalloendopeptidase family protein [Novosphingobium hassiacum]MBB3859797.1 septal ring factor EnvC (AmiA/AmiB activator) [Novosphingobium hassiacum]